MIYFLMCLIWYMICFFDVFDVIYDLFFDVFDMIYDLFFDVFDVIYDLFFWCVWCDLWSAFLMCLMWSMICFLMCLIWSMICFFDVFDVIHDLFFDVFDMIHDLLFWCVWCDLWSVFVMCLMWSMICFFDVFDVIYDLFFDVMIYLLATALLFVFMKINPRAKVAPGPVTSTFIILPSLIQLQSPAYINVKNTTMNKQKMIYIIYIIYILLHENHQHHHPYSEKDDPQASNLKTKIKNDETSKKLMKINQWHKCRTWNHVIFTPSQAYKPKA